MKHFINSIFLIFLFAFSTTLNAQPGWYSLTPPGAGNIYSIYFLDGNTGIAGAYKTTNSGNNWVQVLSYTGYDLCFPSSSVGYNTGSGVNKTTNGGDNWVHQSLNTYHVQNCESFVDINTGWVVGEFAEIFRTTNGGANWQTVPCGLSTIYEFQGVSFVDANTGYVCGFEQNDFTSVILKTTNGGINWAVQNFPNGTTFVSIYFFNALTGFVSGTTIRKTTDGGNTWVIKQSPSGAYGSLQFPSINTGYTLGGYSTVLKSSNGGESWFMQNANTSAFLEDICMVNEYTGFILGWNGKVLKTTDGGGPPIGITPISTEVPRQFRLEQNYPNPFNPSTSIEFSLPEKSFVKIIIYDISGRAVEELAGFELEPGTYKTDWNASNNASGVYFYRLAAGSFTETKKMILTK